MITSEKYSSLWINAPPNLPENLLSLRKAIYKIIINNSSIDSRMIGQAPDINYSSIDGRIIVQAPDFKEPEEDIEDDESTAANYLFKWKMKIECEKI